MKHTKIITWQEIAEVFTIIDGELWRKPIRFELRRVPTNPLKTGYVSVALFGKNWQYHRLLYMLHHQVTLTADERVDHIIEGNKSDNRIENLQVISHSDNKRKAIVYKLPILAYGKYRLNITVKGFAIYIGSFSESEYWIAHAKLQRLFGVGTKGLAFVKSVSNQDVKEFIQLAMAC